MTYQVFLVQPQEFSVIALYIVTDCISTPLNRHSICSTCRFAVRVAHCISTYDLTDITAMNHMICCHALYELSLLREIVSRLTSRITCKVLSSQMTGVRKEKLKPYASRLLLDRMIGLKLPIKKMKFFFKRYIDFETAHGDATTLNSIREKAQKYLSSEQES